MIDPASFALDDNWHGGLYELAIELGPGTDGRLDRALATVWRSVRAGPCYGDKRWEPRAQDPVPCTAESLERFGHLYGVVTLPGGSPSVCGVLAVHEGEDGSDWLVFYLPMGALNRADNRVGGFPFGDDDSMSWRRPIDDWLATVGTTLHDDVRYRLGLIGFDVSGMVSADDLQENGPTEPRLYGILLPRAGALRYLPAQR